MKTQCSSLIFHTASVSSGTGSSVSTPSAPPWHTKVQIHALSAGHFSLPEDQFVSPASPAARKTVPSLCFLIQHSNLMTGITTRILFDLGLRRDIDRYSEPIRHHIASRQPVVTDPDITKSLRSGGLGSEDIDYIIYSHVSSFMVALAHLASSLLVTKLTRDMRCIGTMSANHETSHLALLLSGLDPWMCSRGNLPRCEEAIHSLSQTFWTLHGQSSCPGLATAKKLPVIRPKSHKYPLLHMLIFPGRGLPLTPCRPC